MKKLLLTACLLMAATQAQAKEWNVDYSHSKLGFIGTQGSSSFDGSFKKFETHIDFDPDHPEAGKIAATIDMTSATAGSAERDEVLPNSDWFDTKKFPQAQFVSTSIKKAAQGYEAAGNLTIKGVSQPVTLTFTLAQDGDHWRAQGKAPVMRNEFNIGSGQWANETYIKYAVDVTIDIAAKPAP